ncbi:MAG: hypothetical protein K2O41_05835 [Clostridia bacterium]|nr:hypothetical protein [Clostridia bacterium]
MSGYTKNIAVIRELKNGFSADGGTLTGLIKAEKYGTRLKAEASLINFAPLTEGRYVTAISDGKHTQILDGTVFEGYSEVDTSSGFAALVCFVNGEVSPVASAVCGNFRSAALGIKEEIERAERITPVAVPLAKAEEAPYEDEALAQENYYEFEQTYTDGGAVREDKKKKEDGRKSREDEAAVGSVAFGQRVKAPKPDQPRTERKEDIKGGLAHGMCFYERMKNEIDGLLSAYPADVTLETMVENSKWVQIAYGDGKFYVFGVIYGENNSRGNIPQYLCYGVPTKQGKRPPESLEGLASFIPSDAAANNGYWVMYQDAFTGASVKINLE